MENEVFIGIVVKTVRVKEADVRISLLTAGGLRVVNAPGVTKPSAKLKNAVQLFTIAEFCVNGHRLVGAHVLQNPMGLTREINRYYLACTICEVIERTRTGESASSVFVLTAKTLALLNDTDISCFKIFINFFVKLLVELGYDVEEFCEKFDEFKLCETEEIDGIGLTLPYARGMIKHLEACYVTHLDIKIENVARFL